jgi:hypothetical protein
MAMSQEDSSDGSPRAEDGQLARVDKRSKGRLRWKGLEVSDEFRTYADRVARGEDLPPFTGKILAEPDPAFPWDPKAQQRAARRALKQQVGLWTGVALFLGLSVAVLIVQVRKHIDAWQTQESPLASVTMANQPGTDTLELPAATTAPAAFSEPVMAPELAAGATAAAESALQQAAREEASAVATSATAVSAAAAATAPSVASAAAPVAGATRPASAVKAPAAANPGAGVFVATRAPAAASNPATPAPAGSSSPNVTAAGEPLRAVGTGGTPVASSVTAGADGAGAGDPASALRADPKKEPTREASSMGSLLVESPSF